MQFRFHQTVLHVAATVAVTVSLTACSGGDAEIDPLSSNRLDKITESQFMVISCKMNTIPEVFPLEGKGRELARTDNAILVEIPRSDYESVVGTDGVKKVAVWGEAGNVRKLDHWLRVQLLDAWTADRTREMSCLVRFKNGSTGLKEKLEEVGAHPRTVAGIVVTVEAGPEAILDMLAIPELEEIKQPRLLNPLGDG